ncbi:MAG: hypothetical protein U5J82_01760 [Desulfobacterales bacterium]|nr:hypothetical protein [Desulfobacterales bacterium]
MQRFKGVCTPQGPKTDHAVHVRLTFMEAPSKPGLAPRKAANVYSPPAPAPDEARYPCLAEGIDKIHRQHHHKHGKADHDGMLEDRQDFDFCWTTGRQIGEVPATRSRVPAGRRR